MNEQRKQIALKMLQDAVLESEFDAVSTPLGLWECLCCWAVVTRDRRKDHSDWHTEVHANLVRVRDLLVDNDS